MVQKVGVDIGAPILPEVIDLLERELSKGVFLKEACKRAGISEPSGRKYIKQREAKRKFMNNAGGSGTSKKLRQGVDVNANVALPKNYDELTIEAKRALEDVQYFAERYFGVILMPFQVEWILAAKQSLESPTQDFILVNITTGAGKTTLLIILAAWVTCRDRRVRGMFLSGTQAKAEQNLKKLANCFERTFPIKAKPSEIRAGMAVDAQSTLVADYGIFRSPNNREIWRQSALQIMLPDDDMSSEKEPSWQAYGKDGDVVGNRADFVIADDVWVPGKLRSEDSRQEFFRWWDDEAEERIEPFGTFMLAMQRLGADDLSRYCLDKKVPIADSGREENIVNVFHDGDYAGDDFESDDFDGFVPVYRRLIYKSHYDDRCHGDHGQKARPFPEGCLLYPRRVPWVKIARAKHTNPSKYKLVYQQEDSELPEQLVHPLHITGGIGADGVEYPGCWDKERSECELPVVAGPTLSVMTVDPSPENYWGVIWWVYDSSSEKRFLMDLDNHKLRSGQFLYFNPDTRSYTGLLEEWWQRSKDLGNVITHVILEKNAGQFFFQDPSVQRWATMRGVHLIPHGTYKNSKQHETLGVGVLSEVYRFGKVRLPGSQKGMGRAKCNFLIREVTHYPNGQRTDLLMSQWFLEYNLPNLLPTLTPLPRVGGLHYTMRAAS